MASLDESLRVAREQYAVTLDALHHQALVLQQLQQLLADAAPTEPLVSDHASQTQGEGQATAVSLLRTAELRSKLLRVTSRRQAFARAASREFDELSLSVDALRLEAADSAPADSVVHSILKR